MLLHCAHPVAAEFHPDDFIHARRVDVLRDRLVKYDVTAPIGRRHANAEPARSGRALVLLPLVGLVDSDGLRAIDIGKFSGFVGIAQREVDHFLRIADVDLAALEAFLRRGRKRTERCRFFIGPAF